MRILVAVDDCFLDRPGGMGRVAWDVAVALRQSGHHVAMVCNVPSSGSTATTVTETDGIEIVRYVKPSMARLHPLRDKRSIDAAAQATREKLAAQHWDVVHIHSVFTGTGVIKALGAGPRYVYTMHSPIVLEQKINWNQQGWSGKLKLLLGIRRLKSLEHNILKVSRAIHTLSEFTRTSVEYFHGMGDKVTVIPHWNRPEFHRTVAKAEARQRLGWPLDKKILFTVRSLRPRYGLEIAIQAIAPLARNGNCEFYIGGHGELRSSLDRLVTELGANDNIHFLGRLTDDDLRCAYQAADLFVLPTLCWNVSV